MGKNVILERGHALALLQKSESQYRAIVEDQTELIDRYDASGTILYVNDAYARLYNQTPDAMIGRKQSEFLDKATLQTLARNQIKTLGR